jgi:GNAT superfamily N-acetyltransferase
VDSLTRIEDLAVTEQDDPTAEDILDLKNAVDAFNAVRTGPDNTMPLGLVGCDPSGTVQAGLYGLCYWRWLFVEHLWVAERYRGAGVGSLLLKRAEAVARQRNCVGVCLNTMSFQAPRFYETHGYREFGRLKDVPPGHSRIWLAKRLS